MDIDGIAAMLKDTADKVVNPRFRQLADAEIDEKEPGDFVTVADRESERHLAGLLKEAFPSALIVGEEGVFLGSSTLDELSSAPHAFVIDPIDGTRNFVNGKREHGVMLAEVRDGVTTRGWIWQPQYERMYTVEAGSGQVLMNGVPVEAQPERDKPKGVTGQQRWLGHDGGGRHEPMGRSSGAACFDYPMAVSGEIDFMYYNNAHPWDHLVGCLMLTEIGGTGRMLSGEPYSAASRGKGLLVARSERVWERVAEGWAS